MSNYNLPNGITLQDVEDESHKIEKQIERDEERGEQLRQADVDREMGL